jgi:hypothetical protein
MHVLRFVTLVLAMLVVGACQEQMPAGPAAPTLQVQIRHPHLVTSAVARRPKDVMTYQVTLVAAGTSSAATVTGDNPVSLPAPARTTSFTGMPAGTYEVLVQALDATPDSVTADGQPARSSNKATVDAHGTVSWSANPGAFAVAIVLADATLADTVASAQVDFVTTPLPFTPSLYGIALLNNATLRAEPRPVASITPSSFPLTLTDIQTGDRSGSESTHEYWIYQADDTVTPMTATVAKRQPMPGSSAGALADGAVEVPAVALTNAAPQPAPSGSASPPPPTLSPLPGQVGVDRERTFFVATADGIWGALATDYGALHLLAAPPGLIAMAVDHVGNVYYTTGSHITRLSPPLYATGATVVQAADVGMLAVDGERNLYWRNTHTGRVMKAEFNGTDWEAPADTGVNLAGSPRFAVDAYGDLFYLAGNLVQRAALNDNRTAYGAAATFATCPGTITELTVDRAGDAYYVNAGEGDQIWMTPAGNAGKRFLVAGDGTMNPAATHPSNHPLHERLKSPKNLVVGPTGHFFFTSLDDQGQSILRQM